MAKNIKKYRKVKGYSQEVLAEKAGTSTTHIGMIEIGRKFPSIKMLEQIAGALGIDTPELFSAGTVYFIPHNKKSVERLYQDIISDFEIFRKKITRRIKSFPRS